MATQGPHTALEGGCTTTHCEEGWLGWAAAPTGPLAGCPFFGQPALHSCRAGRSWGGACARLALGARCAPRRRPARGLGLPGGACRSAWGWGLLRLVACSGRLGLLVGDCHMFDRVQSGAQGRMTLDCGLQRSPSPKDLPTPSAQKTLSGPYQWPDLAACRVPPLPDRVGPHGGRPVSIQAAAPPDQSASAVSPAWWPQLVHPDQPDQQCQTSQTSTEPQTS